MNTENDITTGDKKPEKKHPVREGQENSSILNDKTPPSEDTYPYPSEKDKQENNQPEFIDNNPEFKDKKSREEEKGNE